MMRRSKLKKRLLTTFLAVAMTITSVNFGPIGAVTAYAESPATLAAGDYYIVNTATGRLLNGGNSWGSQASALRYGQLMTLVVVDADNGIYNIDSHISNGGEKHFVNVDNGNAFMDGLATPLTIVKCDNGNYTIANADGGYLTASNDDTVVTYLPQSELSEWRILTREELIEEAVKNVAEENPVDVTSLILDSGFARNNTYVSAWNDSPAKGGENTDFCAEKYHTAFDAFQTIENVPNGLYELSVQGFYREDEGSQGPAVYYINGTEKDLMKIEADAKSAAEGGWTTQRGNVFVPNSMTDSSKCFIAGAYKNDAITVLVTDHTLKVGVKTTDANNWVIWDNFTLKLINADAEIAERVVEKINAIGTVELTDECKAKIDDVRAAYDALTDSQKTLITEGQLKVLTDAEAEYDRLWEEGGQQALDQAAAAHVVEKINAIGIVELTDECKAKIDEARTAYDALTDARKELVGAEQLKILTDAEAEYNDLKNAADQAAADAVAAKINAIGTVAFTTESRLAIKVARTAYEALTEDQKTLVTAAQLKVLTDAEAKYTQLVPAEPFFANGDYYIVNASTGKYLNAGNDYQTQASAKTYGQLMTIAVDESDNTIYTIDTHYLKSDKHYLGANGYLDAEETPIKIEKCASGNFSIANADDKFLTAPTEGESTIVTFAADKSAASEWLILSKDQLMERLTKDIAEGNPADVTSLILNPNFDRYNQYSNKWSGGIKIEGAANNYCAEVFQKIFDSFQTIEGVPNGVYELSVQGFYRKDKDTAAPVKYYINGTEAELKTIEADARSEKVLGSWSTQRGNVFVPNSMTDSSNCFSEGAYTNDFITVTVTDHTLKIGVKSTDTNSWVIWDNFTLRLKELRGEGMTDAEVAADVVAKIDAIGTVVLTEECNTKIKAARAAYTALTDVQKALVTAAQLKVLTDAEEKYNELKTIANVIELIDNIGEVSLKPECKTKIDEAREAYDALTAAQRTSVTNYNTLDAAEKEYARLVAQGGQEAVDKAAAADAVEKINAIGTVVFTAECDSKIKEARAAYNGLTEAQKALVTAAQLKVLTDAEEKYNELKTIANVIELIDNIGEVSLAPSCKTKIDEAREAYDALTSAQKTSVTNYNTLDAAEKEYARLAAQGGQEAVDKAAAADAVEKINAIGTVVFTAECDSKIKEARAAYTNLTDAQKALVTEAQLKVLTDAEAKYNELKTIADVIELIDNIGEVSLKPTCKDKIDEARAAYNALTASQKESVTNYNTLEAAETEYHRLENEGGQEAIDQAAAAEAVEKINAIGTVESTEECKAKIKEARAAYNALTDTQKALVTETQLQVLTDAEATYKELIKDQLPSDGLKQELAGAIETANTEALVEEAYTKESWQAYNEALETLKTLSQDEYATKQEIEEALKALQEASDALKVAEGYEPSEEQQEQLATSIEEAPSLDSGEYEEDENWEAFKKALARAQEIKNRPNATAAQVEEAMTDLEEAIANLTPKEDDETVDKTALENAVKNYGKLKSSDYTSSTWNAFKKALDKAKKILKDEEATQEEVDAVLKTLNAKKKALKKVKKVTSIKVSADYTSVAAGKKAKLKAIVKPSNATNKDVKWSVATKDKKYVSISSKGVVTTKKAGAGKTVTVTATAKDGSKKKGTIKIKIMKNAVTKIKLKAKTKKVKAGKKVTVKATVSTNGKKANKKLAWKTSNKKYATVNSKGVVTTKKAGKGKTVTITASSTDGTNKKGTIKIKIVK